MNHIGKLLALFTITLTGTAALAADWSDTAIGYRTSDTLSEPLNAKDTKTDAGYNSQTQMLVADPTLMFHVSGVPKVCLLALWESNAT